MSLTTPGNARWRAARAPARSVSRSTAISIHVPLVPLLRLELGHVLLRPLLAHAALLADDVEQRLVHVPGHALGIAADVEVRAPLQPLVQPPRLLPQPVLDVHLLRAVARERDVHAREHAFLAPAQPFELVEEIGGEAAVAVHEPVIAPVAVLGAVLDEGAERRDAGAGTDHDDGHVAIRGQAEAI